MIWIWQTKWRREEAKIKTQAPVNDIISWSPESNAQNIRVQSLTRCSWLQIYIMLIALILAVVGFLGPTVAIPQPGSELYLPEDRIICWVWEDNFCLADKDCECVWHSAFVMFCKVWRLCFLPDQATIATWLHSEYVILDCENTWLIDSPRFSLWETR